MQWSDAIKPPPDRMLRQFAALSLVVFAGWAAWLTWRGDVGAGSMVLWTLAAVIGGVGLVAPRLIRPIYTGWMIVAFPIGWTVSRVVLGAMLYLVFTPIGLIFRMSGRDALDIHARRPPGASYWKTRQPSRSGKEYLRQY